MTTLTSKYNSAELEKIFSDFNNLDLKKTSYEIVLKKIKDLFAGIICQIIPCPVSPIFRARINKTTSFSNVDQLTFPKPHLLLDYGRLSKPHIPILYASSKVGSAVFEIQPKLNDTITIIKFELRPQFEDLKTYEIGVRDRFFQNIPHIIDRDDKTSLPEDYKEVVMKIESFFIKQISQIINKDESYKYKITAAISEMTFLNNGFAECFLYPSIAGFMEGINVGIKPNVFEEKYIPTFVSEFKIIAEKISKNYKRYDIRCAKTTKNILENGEIKW